MKPKGTFETNHEFVHYVVGWQTNRTLSSTGSVSALGHKRKLFNIQKPKHRKSVESIRAFNYFLLEVLPLMESFSIYCVVIRRPQLTVNRINLF